MTQPNCNSIHTPLDESSGTAARAEAAIAWLETCRADAHAAQLAHRLRGSLATLRTALEVLTFSPIGGSLWADANAIEKRHAAVLDQSVDAMEARYGKCTHR